MTAMQFKGVPKLTEVYEKARGKNKPSLRMIDMGGAPGILSRQSLKIPAQVSR